MRTLDSSGLEGVLNAPVVALDLETTGFDWLKDKIIGVSLAWKRSDSIVAVYIRDPQLARYLLSLLLKNNSIKVGWNLKFDLHFLRSSWMLKGPYGGRFWDGMIASHLLDENTDNELKSSCERAFNPSASLWEFELNQMRKLGLLHSDSRLWEYYGSVDAWLSLAWYLHKQREVHLKHGEVFLTEMDLMQCLIEMEERGVKIDTDYLARLPEQITPKLDEAKKRLKDLIGYTVNHNSPQQVTDLLYSKLKLKALKFTPKGSPKADEESLKTYVSHPVVAAILECRGYEKLLSNYVDGILEKVDNKGYLHGKFNQIGTVSGRMSSSNPNLQNIPRGPLIRQAFLADPWIFDNDYVQIEARLFAHFAAEPIFIEAFEKGLDIHAATYAQLFKVPIEAVTEAQRKRAKTVNFGIMYGSGAEKQARTLGISISAARRFLEGYYHQYPAVKLLQSRARSVILERGYIRNPFGREARLPDNKAYVAVNRLIQGTAADILKKGQVAFWKEFPQFPLRLSVHDELVWDFTGDDPTLWVPRVEEVLRDFRGFKPAIDVDTEQSKLSWGNTPKNQKKG